MTTKRLATVTVAILLCSLARPAAGDERLCDPAFEDCRAPLLNLINSETVGIDVAFWFMTDTRYETALINRWQTASGGPTATLDLNQAPFRLLAIVNRIDLRENLTYGAGSAGEGRLVFGAVDPTTCAPLKFTVIFEYGIHRTGCIALKAWANNWLGD